MEAFFKKYLWVIRFAGIAIVVAFAGSAVVTMIGARVVMGDDAVASLRDAAADEAGEEGDEDDEDDAAANAALTANVLSGDARSRAKAKTNTAEDVVARNIFCPTCQPVEETDVAPEDGPIRPGEIKSTLPLNLLITMVSDDPEASMATIEDTEKRAVGAFSVKEQVREGVTLEEIHRGRVVLLNGRQREFIEIGAKSAEPPTPTKKIDTDRPKPRRKNSRAIDGAEDAIDCSGDSCTVSRDFVNKLIANPALLAKQARVIPDKNGRGFKFYGVRNGSLPKLLGVKNGDLVTEVNGQALTSVDQAMGLYTKLRRASNLSVTIDRRGQTITKDITIK